MSLQISKVRLEPDFDKPSTTPVDSIIPVNISEKKNNDSMRIYVHTIRVKVNY